MHGIGFWDDNAVCEFKIQNFESAQNLQATFTQKVIKFEDNIFQFRPNFLTGAARENNFTNNSLYFKHEVLKFYKFYFIQLNLQRWII